MSEMFATTNEIREQICETCGGIVFAKRAIGVLGSVCWIKDQHHALCGAPCLGGGVRPDVGRSMMTADMAHWTETIHGWKRGRKRACPNGCEVRRG